MKLRNCTAALLLAGALVLTGCGDSKPVDPCQVNPTKTAADGR